MQPSNPASDKLKSILLLLFGCLGILGLLGMTGDALYKGITSFSSVSGRADSDFAAGILNAVGLLFCILLMLPVLYYNLRRLRGQAVRAGRIQSIKAWQLAVLVVAWLVLVLVGSILAGAFDYGWIAAAPLFPFGLALPIAGLAWIAAGGLPTGSRRRLWSVFGISLAGSTVIAVLGEYLVVGVAAAGVLLATVVHPEWRPFIDQMKTKLLNTTDIESAIASLGPYLANPLVLVAMLAFAAGIGPLIEEAAKPLAVWLVGKRLRSPAEGFALGALCGAGFALLEGLMAASGISGSWGFGMAGRAVSSLMHITASGIMGWGIASARLEKRYLRLAGAYLVSVGIHGLWNGSAVLAVYGALLFSVGTAQPTLLAALSMLAGVGFLFLLFFVILAILPLINWRLRLRRPDPLPPPVKFDV